MSTLSYRATNGNGGNTTFSIDTFSEDEIKVYVNEVIKKLNPETTLWVIVSKTFTTQETLSNATRLFLISISVSSFNLPSFFSLFNFF